MPKVRIHGNIELESQLKAPNRHITHMSFLYIQYLEIFKPNS